MKVQYGFYSFVRKCLITACQNEILHLPQHYFNQLCKAATFTEHRSNYSFLIAILHTQFKFCFLNNRPS